MCFLQLWLHIKGNIFVCSRVNWWSVYTLLLMYIAVAISLYWCMSIKFINQKIIWHLIGNCMYLFLINTISFFMFSAWRWAVIVHFVDIGEIVDHHSDHFSATATFHRKVHTKNSLSHRPNLLSPINSFCHSI
jgi:hypothetical protein